MLVGVDILRDNPENVIDAAAGRIAGHDAGFAQNRRFEPLEIDLLVALEGDFHKACCLTGELFDINTRAVSGDDPAGFQPMQALPACRRRKIDCLRQAQFGHATIRLQRADDVHVDLVELHAVLNPITM